MPEEDPEISLSEALELPLLRKDQQTGQELLITGNLKKRFATEVDEYLRQKTLKREERGLLKIEEADAKSVMAFTEHVKSAIDKFSSHDPVTNQLTREEFANVAQYLSWSYFNATENPVEDDKFTPPTQALIDVRRLYFGFKDASERVARGSSK